MKIFLQISRMNAQETQYIFKSYWYRGYVINSFSVLEKKIETIIAEHFKIEDKRMEFIMTIMDRMNFESKRSSLKSIFDNIEVSNGFAKTKNNSYPNSKLFDEIRRLNDQRNYFAHHMLTSNPPKGKVIGITEMRDDINTRWYSEEEIEKEVTGMFNAVKKLDEIWKSHRDSCVK